MLPERVTCDGGFCPCVGTVGTLEGTSFWFAEVVRDDGGGVSSGEAVDVVLFRCMMGLDEGTILAVGMRTWPTSA